MSSSDQVEKMSPLIQVENMSSSNQIESMPSSVQVENMSSSYQVEKLSSSNQVENISSSVQVVHMSSSNQVKKMSSSDQVKKYVVFRPGRRKKISLSLCFSMIYEYLIFNFDNWYHCQPLNISFQSKEKERGGYLFFSKLVNFGCI